MHSLSFQHRGISDEQSIRCIIGLQYAVVI